LKGEIVLVPFPFTDLTAAGLGFSLIAGNRSWVEGELGMYLAVGLFGVGWRWA